MDEAASHIPLCTHVLRSQDTGRVIARVAVPVGTPAADVEFVARNLACQQGIRGVQWLSVHRIAKTTRSPS